MSDVQESVKGEISKTRSTIRELLWHMIELDPSRAYQAAMEDITFMFETRNDEPERKAS